MNQQGPGDAGPQSADGFGIEVLPRRQALADEVHEAIKALLMDHRIAPGDRVSIDGMARELGVSPTPVREALARLESAELVVKAPLRGYRAAPLLTEQQLEDLYRFRLLIEPWAAARAAEGISAAGAIRLRAEMDSCDAPTESGYRSYKELTAHDTRFHLLTAELAGSEQVRLALERTHCHLHIFRLYFDRAVGSKTLEEHRAITEAIASADASAAEQAMRHHLEAAFQQRLRPLYHAPSSTER
ncbi:GntR family transcriptional regulator [Halopolyspora algeriensis]|uniref:GntR family transcriptional regulator n=1 Tax=Halopolyspora algeriensis TaxID=1500506 RepID=A0A368VYA2_9ACTN|nr:GntR family transcriptional regulator [Halopolyspora algeriensis]RCW45812.1 GntR family transcriptional regulator [Halopolyspora algeriensis]TQM54196.1 GntR family transcriptional regulator [Halopolyspora algeriensis]